MSDLVERVQAFTDSTRERWSGSEMSMATALLEEVITALSAPMPDDVAKSVNWLQGLCDIHNAGKVVYMLERQAREIEDLKYDISNAYDHNRELHERIAALEEANRKRKEMNAQMLMNAAESGNRNYLAEIEALQQRIAELEAELQYHREHSGCVETQCQIGLFLDCNIPVAPAQVAPLKQEEKTDG